MKVYSNSRTNKKHRNSYTLHQNIRNNIERLSGLLSVNKSPSLSFSPSIQSVNTEQQALTLAKQFVNNMQDPYQCMLLYPLIIDCPLKYPIDTVFKNTIFAKDLHPLLSLYLHKQSAFVLLEKRRKKIIDVFYRLVNQQTPEVYEDWLKGQETRSIGQWFEQQCINRFLQLVYKDQQQYTTFLTNFLQYGLAYFLLASLRALEGAPHSPLVQTNSLQRIRLCYIDKFGLKLG